MGDRVRNNLFDNRIRLFDKRIKITTTYEDSPAYAYCRDVFRCPVCGDGVAYDTVRRFSPCGFEGLRIPAHHHQCAAPRV